MAQDPFPTPPDLGVPRDLMADMVLLARAYDAQTPIDIDPDDAEDGQTDAFDLASSPNNPTGRLLRQAIRDLADDHQAALVALMWVGRGDYTREEWGEALTAARQRRETPTWRYLVDTPLLGEYWETGLDTLGISITGEEQIALHHPVLEPPAEDDRE
jgi:hypothetical protein